MPYISQTRRDDFEIRLDDLLQEAPAATEGELNYIISRIIWDYFRRCGGRYAQVNEVVGAMECAKLEFYRRVAAPYEDTKVIENGDVYK